MLLTCCLAARKKKLYYLFGKCLSNKVNNCSSFLLRFGIFLEFEAKVYIPLLGEIFEREISPLSLPLA